MLQSILLVNLTFDERVGLLAANTARWQGNFWLNSIFSFKMEVPIEEPIREGTKKRRSKQRLSRRAQYKQEASSSVARLASTNQVDMENLRSIYHTSTATMPWHKADFPVPVANTSSWHPGRDHTMQHVCLLAVTVGLRFMTFTDSSQVRGGKRVISRTVSNLLCVRRRRAFQLLQSARESDNYLSNEICKS